MAVEKKYAAFIVKYFLVFFLTLGIVSAGVSVIIYRIYRKSEINTLIQNENKVLSFQKLIIEEHIKTMMRDVDYLAATLMSVEYIKRGYDRNFDPAVIFKSFLVRRKEYDSLMLLDMNGNEKLRINYKDGKAEKVRDFSLGKNAYASTILGTEKKLPPRVFFLQSSDNKYSLVPVINAGRIITDRNGKNSTVLVLSYPMDNLYRIVYKTGKFSNGMLYFINDKNRIISNEVFDKESFDTLKQIVASEGWKELYDDSGYLVNSKGIVSFVKFKFPGEADIHYYTLASFMDTARLAVFFSDVERKSRYVLLIFLFFSFFVSFIAAVFMSRRKVTRNELLVLRTAFSQSANAIVITDLSGRIRFANNSFQEITGYSLDELIGKNPRALKSGYHDKKFYKNLWETISSGKTWKGLFLNKKKDGSTFWEKATITPVRDERNRIRYYIAVKEDITENKRIENKLRLERERLELARIDAEYARKEAENANKLKSTFLANISHEIRTPMNGILGFARLLAESETDRSKVEKLGIIISSGEFLLELINDILDFSKIEAGEIEITPVKMRIRNILEDVINLLRAKAESGGLKLMVEVSDSVPSVLIGDENRIRQIMINIVANAVKFTTEGYVKVEVDWDDPLLKIDVTDTGIGIPEDRYEAIFQPFKQQDSSTSRKYGGTGLGLAISKRYAEIMGGDISVSSKVGEGTTFTVILSLEMCSDPSSLLTEENSAETDNLLTIWESRLDEEKGLLPILHGVVRQLPIHMENLSQAFINRDYGNAKKIVHNLKGITGNLKMYEIYDKIKELDGELGKSDIDDASVQQLYRNLNDLLENIIERGHFSDIKDADDDIEELELAESESSSLKVLAVDDDEANRVIIKEYLRLSGYDTEVAGNGIEALEKLGKEQFDILIIDIQMPVMDGVETVKRIRSDRNFEGLYIIAVTGNACDDQEGYLDNGFDECLSKPVDREILIDKIRKAGAAEQFGWIIEELSLYEKAFNAGKLLTVVKKIEQRSTGRLFIRLAERIRDIAEGYDTNALADLIQELKELKNGE